MLARRRALERQPLCIIPSPDPARSRSHTMPPPLERPPQPLTRDGRPRKVGVEIEFAEVEVAPAADLVASLFGGRPERRDDYRYEVVGTRFGDFMVELDSLYAHPEVAGKAKIPPKIKGKLASAVGGVVGLWLPNEIVAPPMRIDDLPELDRLIAGLRERKALGTSASILYGFGLQLNPEVAERTAEYVLRHLKAYVILSPWLRDQIQVDATRRLLPFADPFPPEYVRAVLAPGYAPDLETLIGDYMDANPTRNRELDLMPLFAELAPEVVARRTDDPHIKARPTFHYRLPNARIDEHDWDGVVGEWNRWVQVERLAADPTRLEEARAETHERLGRTKQESRLGWLKGWLNP